MLCYEAFFKAFLKALKRFLYRSCSERLSWRRGGGGEGLYQKDKIILQNFIILPRKQRSNSDVLTNSPLDNLLNTYEILKEILCKQNILKYISFGLSMCVMIAVSHHRSRAIFRKTAQKLRENLKRGEKLAARHKITDLI